MSLILLLIAGLMEVGWAIGLKYTDGFTRPVPTALTVAGTLGSVMLLAIAARSLPIGTAYAVWVGIGTIGTVAFGVVLFDEPVNVARIGFLALVAVGVVGLRFAGE
ncbi:MAG TPA: multidrug efflux SMR transporter [Dehalococcoidia bacterium]|nr:multidrug efflux SMR transporter [Dehalococcoidia bacterium]